LAPQSDTSHLDPALATARSCWSDLFGQWILRIRGPQLEGTTIVFWIYLSNWGALAFKGAAYSLGRALIWPVVVFPSLGQLIGGVIIVGLVLFATFFVRRRPA